MPLQAEALEQRLLRHRPLAHHRSVSARLAAIESNRQHYFKAAFFNTIDHLRTFARTRRGSVLLLPLKSLTDPRGWRLR